MNQSIFARAVLLLLAMGVGIAGCSKDDDTAKQSMAALGQADDVLMYVPADTPYVFASLESMPDDILDKLEANADSMVSAYETVIKETLKTMAAEGDLDDDEDAAKMIALIGEMTGLMRSDQLRAAGVPRSPRVAIYGVGLLPVVRMNLSDPDAFDAKITELAEEVDAELAVGKVDGQTYRYAGDEEARLVVAVIGKQAVASIVPATLSDEQLGSVLGLTLPAESMADTGAMQDLARRYDFGFYALGFVDIERLTATFLDPASGVNAELLDLMEYDPASLSDVCRAEIRQASGIAPRFVSGYTSVTTGKISTNTILEMRDDIARGLATLSAPVPGMGMDHGGFASFGMSLDLLAARDFYEARLDALEADPYKCEYFAEFQAGVAQGRQAMNQPLPPIVYGFNGIVAVIDDVGDIDFSSQQPPTDIDARVLVANDNAEGLLAMGTMFSPELAALNLQADGKPVELNLPPFTAEFDAAYVAMTDTTLGVSVGDGSDSRLADLLSAPAANPPPFMSMSIDGARYYDYMSQIIQAGANTPNPDGSPNEVSKEMQIAMSQVMTGVGDLIERITVDVTFTDRGMEMPSTLTLAD
jgi:hypothetical protein